MFQPDAPDFTPTAVGNASSADLDHVGTDAETGYHMQVAEMPDESSPTQPPGGGGGFGSPDPLLTGTLLPSFAASGFDDASAASGAYSSAANNAPAVGVRRRTWLTRFLPEHVYEYYARQCALQMASLPPGHPRLLEIPAEFTSVLPLDRQASDESAVTVTGSFGYVTSVYKVVSVEDGMVYALRRVENVRATPAVLQATTAAWRRAAHPSIVTLRRAFAGAAASGGGVFFLHDFYPGARTLRELYLEAPRGEPPLPERVLWSIICQCVAGLRAAHDAGLSFHGTVHATHVLVTGHNRVRLCGAGVLDVAESDSAKTQEQRAAADMFGFGHMLLELATRLPSVPAAGIGAALATVNATYSTALHTLIVMLLSKPVPVADVCRFLAPQLLAELDSQYDHADAMEALLAREADNGRLLRLLVKLGFVNERAALEGDPAWSETGDRYQLQLYRDFLFHQVRTDGRLTTTSVHPLLHLPPRPLTSPLRSLTTAAQSSTWPTSSSRSTRSTSARKRAFYCPRATAGRC